MKTRSEKKDSQSVLTGAFGRLQQGVRSVLARIIGKRVTVMLTTAPVRISRPGGETPIRGAYASLVSMAELMGPFTNALRSLPCMVPDLGEIESVKARAEALAITLKNTWDGYVRKGDDPRLLPRIALQEAESTGVFPALEGLFKRASEFALTPKMQLVMAGLREDFDKIAFCRGEAIRLLTVLAVRRDPDVVKVKLGYSINEALERLCRQGYFVVDGYGVLDERGRTELRRVAGEGDMHVLAAEGCSLLQCALTLPLDFALGVDMRTLQFEGQGLAEELSKLSTPGSHSLSVELDRHAEQSARYLLARRSARWQQRVRIELLKLWPLSESWGREDRLALAALLDAADRLPTYVPSFLLNKAEKILGADEPLPDLPTVVSLTTAEKKERVKQGKRTPLLTLLTAGKPPQASQPLPSVPQREVPSVSPEVLRATASNEDAIAAHPQAGQNVQESSAGQGEQATPAIAQRPRELA